MPAKQAPYLEAWCYPLSPQTRWAGRCFALADQLGNLNRGQEQRGGYTGLQAATGVVTGPISGPGQGGHISDVDNLEWVDLWDDTDKTAVSGYAVRPRYVPMSSLVAGEAGVNPPEQVPALVWVPSHGQDDSFQTCLPDREPLATALRQSSTDLYDIKSATTQKSLPASQPFRLELQCLGVGRAQTNGVQPWLRVSWANAFSIYLVAGQTSALMQYRSSGSSGRQRATLAKLRDLPFLDAFWQYGTVIVDVLYYAGRLLVRAAEGQVVYSERVRSKVAASPSEGKVSAVKAPAAPLWCESQGVAYTCRPLEVAYADGEIAAGGTSYEMTSTNASGSFARRFFSTGRVTAANTEMAPHGYRPGMPTQTQGARPDDLATLEVRSLGNLEYAYDCVIPAHAPSATLGAVSWRTDVLAYSGTYAMRGHSSPLVHSVTLRQQPSLRQVTTADPVDIRPALIRAHENMADPALQAGPMWTLQASRNILPDLAHPSGGTLGNGWSAYVNRYHAIAINTGWLYDDGVVRAYDGAGGTDRGKVCRLYGYISSQAPDAQKVGVRPLEIAARDPLMRLQKPAGLIDSRFCALDFLLCKRLGTISRDRVARIWGADGVRYILETGLGPDVAEDLQVFYPGFQGLWSESARPSQWSLMDYAMWADPPSGSGFLWPAPFGADMLSWITRLCEVDFAAFFYGPSITDARNVAPTYANYWQWLAYRATTPVRIPDAIYQADDENYILHGAGWRQNPDSDYNRVLVWGQAPGQGDLGGLMPAFPQFSREAMVVSTLPEQRADLTWERTQVAQGTHFYLPGVASSVALALSALLRDVESRRVAARCRGIEYLWWGDKVYFDTDGAESDPALDLRRPGAPTQAQHFRVMRIGNDYDLERNTWTASLGVVDQPNTNPLG